MPKMTEERYREIREKALKNLQAKQPPRPAELSSQDGKTEKAMTEQDTNAA
jgi:hypothetical protein